MNRFGGRRRGSAEEAKVVSGMCKTTLDALGPETHYAQWSAYPSGERPKAGVDAVPEPSFRFRSG